MEWAALFNLLQSWGPTAISSVLVIVVLYLIRKIDSNSKENEQHAAALRADINKTLNSFGERLSNVEHNYVKNDFFFRELSGWKSEINRLADKVDSKFEILAQNIIQVINRGKND
ncbi:MAG: hypothetical protein FWD36_03225 [Treponema sp.]|nr:hypothetical protein [Treponema sp.]